MNDHKNNGAGAAAIIAAGVGSFALGACVMLAELSPAAKKIMTLSSAVGPLSGKTTFAIVAWLVAWSGLHLFLREKEVDMFRTAVLAFLLIAFGFLMTFPPFFLLFE